MYRGAMNISSNARVNDFLTDLQFISAEQFDMMILIRGMFLKSNKNLVEDIKYGGLTFNLSGTLIGGIYAYKEHVSIEFSNGADFTDLDSILDGKGKKRRHVKIHTSSDISKKNSEYFINQASNEGDT